MLTKAFQAQLKGDVDMPASEIMSKFKKGMLHSGSSKGPKVANKKQAVAIMLSEKKQADAGKKEYKEKVDTGPSKKLRKKLGMK
jgi:hypothetical protein